MMPWTVAIALLVAFGVDRRWGEPAPRWHPVVWMGHYLGWIGRRVAPRERAPAADWRAFAFGALAWAFGAFAVALLACLLQSALLYLDEVFAGLLLGLLLKPMFSWRMLRDEVEAVEVGLARSLMAGRAQLGRLVSRDVTALDEDQVRESAIESLDENLNDSVVAPVFWFLLAGLPGAVIYRFANTADAMWGYRGVRAGRHWEWAGKWAARADDLLSWIPARLTALLIAAVRGCWSLRQLRREARRTPSPNSGWPMAAMALVLGTRLSKPGVYALNERGSVPGSADLASAVRLSGHAVALLLAFACLMPFLQVWMH
jgi:adenosylcobinamide-phosphate synthase